MTRKIADEQPYIFRLTRLGQAAARRGKSLVFCDEVSRLIWGGAENWHEGDHLAGAATRAGLDLDELDAEARRLSCRRLPTEREPRGSREDGQL
jgi:hypothetical protein